MTIIDDAEAKAKVHTSGVVIVGALPTDKRCCTLPALARQCQRPRIPSGLEISSDISKDIYSANRERVTVFC